MHHIVILGGGFAGIRAALKIGKAVRRIGPDRCTVTLVARDERHTYTPLLYEVATTSKETANLTELYDLASHRIEDILAGLPVRFVHAEVSGIDLVNRTIALANGGSLPADTCIVALGAETNYYGIAGLAERSYPLKTVFDAVRIRDMIWDLAMERPRGAVRVVVGGGGPTGVELAGELRMLCGELGRELHSCELSVTLVQGAPTILPQFSKRTIALAQKRLRALGAELRENERITAVRDRELETASGARIPFDVLVWSGGIKGPSALASLPVKLDRLGHAGTDRTMLCMANAETVAAPHAYVIGDAACVIDPKTNQPVPWVARAAISQATVAAANAVEDLRVALGKKTKPVYRTYTPTRYPHVTPIGGKYAIAEFGPVRIVGFFGWVLKGLVELNYLASIMPLRRALRIWFTALFVFVRNDRLG
jgi:NADH dehydrogenase